MTYKNISIIRLQMKNVERIEDFRKVIKYKDESGVICLQVEY